MKNSKNPLAWIERDELGPKDPKKTCRVCPRCRGESDQGAPENEGVLGRLCDPCFSSLSERELVRLGTPVNNGAKARPSTARY